MNALGTGIDLLALHANHTYSGITITTEQQNPGTPKSDHRVRYHFSSKYTPHVSKHFKKHPHAEGFRRHPTAPASQSVTTSYDGQQHAIKYARCTPRRDVSRCYTATPANRHDLKNRIDIVSRVQARTPAARHACTTPWLFFVVVVDAGSRAYLSLLGFVRRRGVHAA